MVDSVFILDNEPRVRRRFWTAERRIKRWIADTMPTQERLSILVPSGLGHNRTSSGSFVVGQISGIVTYLGQ